MMKLAIAQGRLVTIHFRLTLEDGSVVDSSFEGDPLVYRQGTGAVVPGLERALIGKCAGDECEVRVDPADGYGDYDPAFEKSVPRSQLPPDLDIRTGASLQAKGPEGQIRVWVRRIEGDEVIITTNHPLSGWRLVFEVRVIDVREASAEEQPEPDT